MPYDKVAGDAAAKPEVSAKGSAICMSPGDIGLVRQLSKVPPLADQNRDDLISRVELEGLQKLSPNQCAGMIAAAALNHFDQLTKLAPSSVDLRYRQERLTTGWLMLGVSGATLTVMAASGKVWPRWAVLGAVFGGLGGARFINEGVNRNQHNVDLGPQIETEITKRSQMLGNLRKLDLSAR